MGLTLVFIESIEGPKLMKKPRNYKVFLQIVDFSLVFVGSAERSFLRFHVYIYTYSFKMQLLEGWSLFEGGVARTLVFIRFAARGATA